MTSASPVNFDCFKADTIGDEFEFFSTAKDFGDAVKFCSDRGSTLARVSSQEEFEFVKELVNFIPDKVARNTPTSRVWLGIHDPDDVTGPGNTGFSFVDGFQNTSFFAEAEKFPWANREPNNANQLSDNQSGNCVNWRLDKDQRHLWGDDVCSLERLFLCRKKGSCLIVPPTAVPTESPTLSPAGAPTFSPTLTVEIESLSAFQTVILTLIAGSTLGVLIFLGRKKYINKKRREADRGDRT